MYISGSCQWRLSGDALGGRRNLFLVPGKKSDLGLVGAHQGEVEEEEAPPLPRGPD